MAWPTGQDYNEALQSPAISFAEPELRFGQPVVTALGIPRPRSGNFADVYEFQGAGGSKWAIKCFTREVPGLPARYSEISKHLVQARLPFTVDFQYLERGILSRGRWYPILKMQWIEGLLLNEFVRNNLDRPALLEGLTQIWVRLARRLHEAGIAHADLQHGNVILVAGSKASSLAVKLIDYDGLWVPALAQAKSGEVGHASYQHPRRNDQGIYNAEVDRFPLLAIACALRALTVGGKPLWDRYDNGDNLLFRGTDLRKPADSALFRELWKSPDPGVHHLTGHVVLGLAGPLEQVPLLTDIFAEQQPRPLSSAEEEQAAALLQAARPGVLVSEPSSKTVPAAVAETTWQTLTDAQTPLLPRQRRRAASHSALWLTAVTVVVLLAGATGFVLSRKAGPEPAKHEAAAGKKTKPPPAKPVARPEKKPARIKPLQNSIGMKLVRVPGGKFQMGTTVDDLERFMKLPFHGYDFSKDFPETPQHEVRITRSFHLSMYEVTQGQYEKVMGINPAANKESPDHPVEKVTWSDAMEFCEKLSALSGEAKRSYRLPTEAEWEYVCRAGTTTAFHYGDTLDVKQANIDGARPFGAVEPGNGPKKTVKVGSYQPNAWGLYDMHGNVWEWCLDGPRLYTADVVTDPRGREDKGHVLRGGGFNSGACRSALRKARPADYATDNCGFRVVCEP